MGLEWVLTENRTTTTYAPDLAPRLTAKTHAKGAIFDASTPGVRPSTAHSNSFVFTGREWIREIGLYDYRHRVYSPELGRFLQTDPIRFDAGDVNLYRYVSNSSVNWVDPLGLFFWTTWDACSNIQASGCQASCGQEQADFVACLNRVERCVSYAGPFNILFTRFHQVNCHCCNRATGEKFALIFYGQEEYLKVNY